MVIVYRVQLRGRNSQVALDQRLAQSAEFRDGKIVRSKLYRDVDKALEAVGLSE